MHTKKIWKKAGVNPEDDDIIILYSYVNSIGFLKLKSF
jgi:hypothetical protein